MQWWGHGVFRREREGQWVVEIGGLLFADKKDIAGESFTVVYEAHLATGMRCFWRGRKGQFRHNHSCKRPLYKTFLVASFFIVSTIESFIIGPQYRSLSSISHLHPKILPSTILDIFRQIEYISYYTPDWIDLIKNICHTDDEKKNDSSTGCIGGSTHFTSPFSLAVSSSAAKNKPNAQPRN